ncbi:MAG: efflux RND transporter periplasmic adaptor subunit [Mucilaginibacter sp.]|nr:efflux RND transporter periplasmic adaptor subunit [Mucilaginibacter sp.]
MTRNVMFVALCVLLYNTGCTSNKEEKTEETATYAATSPLKIDTSYTKEYVSQIKSVRNIEVRAQEKGYLQKIYVDEGQFVKAGQPLFRIMPQAFEAELQKAEAETRSAELELQNTKTLSDQNIVSKSEYQLGKAKLDQAKAEQTIAKMHLAFTEIKAPFDGIIDRIPLKLGALVDEGALLTSLSDNSQMFAYFNVSEPEYLNYQTDVKDRGARLVDLQLANGQLFKYKGDVETVESEFDSETGNIAFRARFKNPDKLLRNGETGKVLMTVPFKNALVIPQKATYEVQDKIYVFVIDNNNVVKSTNIEIGASLPDMYVVQSGLSANDKILLEGVQKVHDNDKIKYKFQKPEDVLSHLKLQAE